MCASIRQAVPALDGDVVEYMASSVLVASEDLDEPQPISADRVASLVEPFLEDEGLDETVVSALSGAIAQLFEPAANQSGYEPEVEPTPDLGPTLKQPSSPQQDAQFARDCRVERLTSVGGEARGSERGRRRSRNRGGGTSRSAGSGGLYADTPAGVVDKQEPEPEPELLESILGPDAFHRCGPHDWEIDVDIACPSSVKVEWILGTGENQAINTFIVGHLPPLTLAIERSPGYPSHSPPQFMLRCHCKMLHAHFHVALHALNCSIAHVHAVTGLGYDELSKLAAALDGLWESAGGGGEPVLYTWVEFLKDNGWSAAGLSGSPQRDGEQGNLHLGGVEAAKPVTGHDSCSGDLRVVPMLQMTIRSATARSMADEHDAGDQADSIQAAANALERCVMELMRFDTFAAARAFDEASHTCEVCYDDKPGKLFTKIHCGHNFCTECMGGMAAVHITDGALEMLRCPEMDCSAQLETEELRRLVDASAFER